MRYYGENMGDVSPRESVFGYTGPAAKAAAVTVLLLGITMLLQAFPERIEAAQGSRELVRKLYLLPILLASSWFTGRGAAAAPRDLARAVLTGSQVGSVEVRKALVEAAPAAFEASGDPGVVFARELEPAIRDQRTRVRILNEKILGNRARFARGVSAWRGSSIYPDANFTLRASYGRVASVAGPGGSQIPFATTLGDLFALAERRGNAGDFALPPRLLAWRKAMGEAAFGARYAGMVVNFISTNDITGGNSGSSTLNRRLDIVGLIFDGNEGSMASDWSYNARTGRALSTDIRFALTVARDVHGAGWIVDELLKAQ